MNRLLILLIGLLVRGVLAQAQTILASNSLNKSGIPTILEAAPLKPKATDSPFYVKVSGFYGLLTPGYRLTTVRPSTQARYHSKQPVRA